MALRRHLRILAGGIDAPRSGRDFRDVGSNPCLAWPASTGAILPMTPTLKIAFATGDRHKVDQHFGSASALLIYEVGPQKSCVVEFAEFGELEQDGHESKLAAKFDLLQGCAAVYCQAVGGSAIQQLLGLGVQPMRVAANTSIATVLDELQAALRDGNAPAWLQRSIARQQPVDDDTRFAAMEAEGWQE